MMTGETTGTIRFGVGKCSLGALAVATTRNGICAILLGDHAGEPVRELRDRFPGARPADEADEEFRRVVARVAAFVDVPAEGLDLPLDPQGTIFQRQVWEALREVPPGSTVSYLEIARRLGVPRAAYLVGEACAANTIAVAIPCHRVVRKDGSLGGYRWGIRRKRALLEREAASCLTQ
jgi:AraC family transcriptional regulator of adaptative response/methylated-DNA-[protein]-cysteine methyltransferase